MTLSSLSELQDAQKTFDDESLFIIYKESDSSNIKYKKIDYNQLKNKLKEDGVKS